MLPKVNNISEREKKVYVVSPFYAKSFELVSLSVW